MKGMKKGLVIAGTAAALMAAGFVAAPAFAADVKCQGANACKGKSECKSANNACKGQNTCKGKGFVSMSDEAACKKAGGTVMEDKG